VAGTSRPGRRDTRRTRHACAEAEAGRQAEQIIEAAIDHFGRYGYEETKWADVAAAVGIGSTTLYHYFESKRHCLFEIMGMAVADFRGRFDRLTVAHDDWSDALVAVLRDQFDLTDTEVLRLRVLVAEVGRLGASRTLPREEAARAGARAQIRDLEFTWGTFIARGMAEGVLPENDPRLLTRAVLWLYNSVWHWYEPDSSHDLARIGRFYVNRELAILGCSSELIAALAAAT
jgi:AcrR family transcriptional regulator